MDERIESGPVLLVAMALAMEFREYAHDAQDSAEKLLAAMFAAVRDALPEQVTAEQAIAVTFLNEYFGHRGDWSAMCRCLEDAAQDHAGISRERIEQIAVSVRDDRSPFSGVQKVMP